MKVSYGGSASNALFDGFDPVFLTEAGLLSADDVDVMRDEGQSRVPCLAGPLGPKPVAQILVRRRWV